MHSDKFLVYVIAKFEEKNILPVSDPRWFLRSCRYQRKLLHTVV